MSNLGLRIKQCWVSPWGQTLLGVLLALVLVELTARGLQAYTGLSMSYSKLFDNKYELLMNTPDSGRPMLVGIGDSFMYYAFHPETFKARLHQQGVDIDAISVASPATNITEQLAYMQLASKRFKHPVFLLGLSFRNSNMGSLRQNYLPIGDAVINLNHRPPNYMSRCVMSPGVPLSMGETAYCWAGQYSAFVRLLPSITELLLPPSSPIKENVEQKHSRKMSEWEYSQMSALGGGGQEYRPPSIKALIYHMVEPKFITYYATYTGADVRMDWAYWPFKDYQTTLKKAATKTPPVMFLYLPMLDRMFDDFALDPHLETTSGIDKKAHHLAQQLGWHYQDCHGSLTDLTLFKDYVHLNLGGSVAFSTWLAQHGVLPKEAVEQTPAPTQRKEP